MQAGVVGSVLAGEVFFPVSRRTTKELRKPKRLGAKLAAIRRHLQLSQNELINRLGFPGELVREEISAFERGVRVPPVIVLLEYARAVNISVEVLIDDKLEFPPHLADKMPKKRSRQTTNQSKKG
jgi:transcriptional regulator with XRE-family HTH domain